MGYMSHRYSKQLKVLDLRLELRKAEVDLRNVIEALPSLLEYANLHRKRASGPRQQYYKRGVCRSLPQVLEYGCHLLPDRVDRCS